MERNYGVEIDSLKEELKEIKELLIKNAESDSSKANDNMVGHVQKNENMHPDQSIMDIMNRLEDTCGENGETGEITYLGVFASGGRQSSWVRNQVNTDNLLKLVENKVAEKVLACIGNGDRLNILISILKKPMTVAQIVEECGYNSTGQVYHHIKPLIAADLIIEDEQNYSKGTYNVQPHKVQGIIMLLAGISDMVDEAYTQGYWE